MKNHALSGPARTPAHRPRPVAPKPDPIRTVHVDKVLVSSSGGCNTRAMVARVEGKKVFLKSNRGSMMGYTRYANWESDLLTQKLCERLHLRCPKAEVVRLEDDDPVRQKLGPYALAMQFVDSRLEHGPVRGGVYHNRPGEKSNDEDYLKMFVLDCLIGNADRRNANYFTVEKAGGWEPILIDNNAGFGNLYVSNSPSNHCNFIKSFDGLGKEKLFQDMGTIEGCVQDADYPWMFPDHPEWKERAIEIARELPQLLDDEFIDQIVGELPRQVLPHGLKREAPPRSLRKYLHSDEVGLLYDGPRKELSGKELWEARQEDLRSTLKWRRDHLAEALQSHFQTHP